MRWNRLKEGLKYRRHWKWEILRDTLSSNKMTFMIWKKKNMLHILMAKSVNLSWICSNLPLPLPSKEKHPGKGQCLYIFFMSYLILFSHGLYFFAYLLYYLNTVLLLDHCRKCRNPLPIFPRLKIPSPTPHPFLATSSFLYFPSWSFESIFYKPCFLLSHLPVTLPHTPIRI